MPDLDALVKQNRALTPKVAAEARKVPRSSIAELNDMDLDEIRDRYISHGYDDRSPVTKVLDLIDLPRNVVANVLFRGSGAVDSAGLRKGTFGLPVVSTSDALSSLGIKNHLVRGIAGFVGDVALDPLTYLGPAGWGIEVMSDAGRAVRVGKSGSKALRTGIKDVAKGTLPRDPHVRGIYEQILANAPDDIKAADNARRSSYFSEKALGKIGPETKVGTPFYYLSRGLGGDARAKGAGNIADELVNETPLGDAVRDFVGKYSPASGPGVGKGGSQIAHIPFTEYSAKVPGFTKAGRAVETDLAIAKSSAPRAAEEIATPTIIRAGQLAREIADLNDNGEDATPLVTELANLVSQTEASPIAPKNPREIFALQKYLDEADAGMAASRAKRSRHQSSLTGNENIDDLAENLDDAALDELSDSAKSTFEAYQRYRGSVTGAVRNFAQDTPQDKALLDSAMRFLGTDDQIVGRASFAGPDAMLRNVNVADILDRAGQVKRTVFGERGTSLSEAGRELRHATGPGARRAVNTYIGEVTGELRKAFADSGINPTGDDLDDASTLLMALATKTQAERGAAKVGEGVYYTHAFGDSSKLAPYLQRIEDARNGGRLAEAMKSGLMARLEEIASKYGADLIDELGNIEHGEGLLQSLRAGMVPNIPTPAASAAMKSAGKYQKTGARMQSAQREAFQKGRSMDQVRWTSPIDGTEKRLFRAELDQARRFARDPNLIDALEVEGRPDLAESMRNLVRDFEEYSGLPEGQKPSFRNTDPFEMNDLAKAGRFSMLLDGIDPVGGFMQTNMIAAMAQRLGSHERAMARSQWSQFVDKFGLKMPEFAGAKWKPKGDGQTLVAPDGSQARIVTAYDGRGNPVKAVEMGGQKYRPVQGLKVDNPIADMLGPKSAQTIYHENVASAIERTARLFDEPSVLLDGINTLTRQWKNITLLHPSWTIFNLIGDSLNALQGGANARHFFNPNFAKFAAKVQRFADQPERLRNMILNINGQEVNGEQVLHDMVRQKVIDGTMMEEAALKMVENKIFTLPGQAGNRFRPAVIKSDFKDAAQRYASARDADAVSRGEKFKAAGYVASDRYLNNFLGPWFRFNQKVSNYVRTQTYLAFLADGYSPGAAARKVVESQFDYCVDEETQILTDRGWIGYKELTTSDKAFSYNTKTGESEFVEISAVNVFENKQRDMYRVTSNVFDALVTDGHKWICSGSGVVGGHHSLRKKSDLPKGHLVNTEDLAASSKVMITAGGDYVGPDMPVYSDEFVRLIAWVVTEGSFLAQKGYKCSGVVVSQSIKHNPEHVDEIQGLADHYASKGATTSRYERDVGYGTIATFYFGKGIADEIRRAAPGKSITPEFLLRLTRHQLGIFYRTLMNGDGHVNKCKSEIWAQKDQGRIDGFQMLCAMLGHRSTARRKSYHNGCANITAIKSSVCYANGMNWEKVSHSGIVWCPTTKHGTWFARRNGITYWTGNSDSTKIESDVFRTIWPFASWIRNNGAYQIKRLLDRPAYTAAFPKVQAAIEEAIAGDDKVPQQLRPNWMRAALALQVGKNPESRSAILFGSGLPIADVYQYLTPILGAEGVMDFAHYFGSGLNPILNVPLQLATGQETFSGRTIGADPYTGDISAGEFLRNQIRPIAEVGKIGRAYRDGGITQAVGRAVLGGRVQDFSQDRLETSKLREFTDAERRIRAAITKAERTGDKERSLRGRVKLLELYSTMQDAGFEVPKWARKQLAEVSGG